MVSHVRVSPGIVCIAARLQSVASSPAFGPRECTPRKAARTARARCSQKTPARLQPYLGRREGSPLRPPSDISVPGQLEIRVRCSATATGIEPHREAEARGEPASLRPQDDRSLPEGPTWDRSADAVRCWECRRYGHPAYGLGRAAPERRNEPGA